MSLWRVVWLNIVAYSVIATMGHLAIVAWRAL